MATRSSQYLQRLRSTRDDAFIGALFDTYAAAAFLKAGFTLSYKETKPKSFSSVEFVAIWPKTGDQFSVEVKSRIHSSDPKVPEESVDEVKRLRVGAKPAKAPSKAASHARVVMIEINVPDQLKASGTLDGWPAAALKQIRDNEGATDKNGTPLSLFRTRRGTKPQKTAMHSAHSVRVRSVGFGWNRGRHGAPKGPEPRIGRPPFAIGGQVPIAVVGNCATALFAHILLLSVDRQINRRLRMASTRILQRSLRSD